MYWIVNTDLMRSASGIFSNYFETEKALDRCLRIL